MKLKKLGYVGYTDDKPYFERVIDDYSTMRAVNVYKLKKEARKRFEDVREVFVKEAKKS
jgi:hypothetical protein